MEMGGLPQYPDLFKGMRKNMLSMEVSSVACRQEGRDMLRLVEWINICAPGPQVATSGRNIKGIIFFVRFP